MFSDIMSNQNTQSDILKLVDNDDSIIELERRLEALRSKNQSGRFTKHIPLLIGLRATLSSLLARK
jgi:hypothetical protein